MQRVREIETELEHAGKKKVKNVTKGGGLQLRNKNFVINVDFKNKERLEVFKADFYKLKRELKHNPYDPWENTEE